MADSTSLAYTTTFFDEMEDGALRSASVILPIVFNLLSPRSMVDVGCGRGAWLRVARELGLSNVIGLDGAYVDAQSLLIPADSFRPTDLRRFQATSRHDLALCLEVAEHLPKSAGPALIAGLTASAPAVLFSAAIPGQPGTRHINPQFPEYWCRLFHEHGFVALDAVRPSLRSDSRVEPWYAQNVLLYVSREYYQASRSLREYAPISDPEDLLPWVYGAIWRSRAGWRGPLSILKLLLAHAYRSRME